MLLGAAARRDGEALLRPKVHFFIRGLDEMTVALDGEPENLQVQLFMSLADARGTHPNRRDDAFLPVLTCRNCGQHFFERYYQTLELATGSKGDFKDFASWQRYRRCRGAVQTPSGRRPRRERGHDWS